MTIFGRLGGANIFLHSVSDHTVALNRGIYSLVGRAFVMCGNKCFLFLVRISILPFSSFGGQKLRPWLGNPTWISGIQPSGRFFSTLASLNSDLYLYGGAFALIKLENGVVTVNLFPFL